MKFERNIASEIFRIKKLFSVLCLGALTFITSACATSYRAVALRSWDLMARGESEVALELYQREVKAEADSLLKLMDEGILLRVLGRFDESNKKFLEAADIIELAGYALASEEIVGAVANEKRSIYQGEDFEKILIHAYLALNFIALENWDAALVSARKVNEVLFIMMSEAGKPYQWNSFAKYLTGLLYEKDREFNDAYISFKQIYEEDPEVVEVFAELKIDLLRGALRMGFSDEVARYRKSFGEEAFKKADESLRKHQASVVLLFESGKSPQKFSSEEKHSQRGASSPSVTSVLLTLPRYQSRDSQIKRAELRIGDQVAKTSILNDIEKTAFAHLEDRMSRYIAKALVGAATKVGIAAGVGVLTKNEDLAVLTGLLLFAASGADTRSWLLLPHKLQTARLNLLAGQYSVEIHYLNGSGESVFSETLEDLRLEQDQVYFIQRRSFL